MWSGKSEFFLNFYTLPLAFQGVNRYLQGVMMTMMSLIGYLLLCAETAIDNYSVEPFDHLMILITNIFRQYFDKC